MESCQTPLWALIPSSMTPNYSPSSKQTINDQRVSVSAQFPAKLAQNSINQRKTRESLPGHEVAFQLNDNIFSALYIYRGPHISLGSRFSNDAENSAAQNLYKTLSLLRGISAGSGCACTRLPPVASGSQGSEACAHGRPIPPEDSENSKSAGDISWRIYSRLESLTQKCTILILI